MRHADRLLLEIVELIYAAAVDSTQWTVVLTRLGRELRADMCALHVHDIEKGHRSLTAAIGHDPAYYRSYQEHYGKKNAFLIHGKQHLWPGNVCLNYILCPDQVLFRSEFYNDWMAQQGMLRAIDATILKEESLTSVLALIYSSRTRRAPDEEDAAFVKALMPHLQRATQLHHRIADLQALKRAADDALDRWPLGVIMLDREGQVVFLNRAAEKIVCQNDGLSIRKEGLCALLAEETGKLQMMVRNATLTAEGRGVHSGGALTLRRMSSERPLTALIAPLSPLQKLVAENTVTCLVFVSDPDSQVETDEGLLRKLYALTPAEAKVAALLLDGCQLKQIADQLRVRMNTARTHLKMVLGKTSTAKQTEFMRLIMRSPISGALKH